VLRFGRLVQARVLATLAAAAVAVLLSAAPSAWSSGLSTGGAETGVVGTTPVSAMVQDGEPGYLDDRSTASQLVRSYFNAVNRREYARAYSYWQAGAAERDLPPFDEFASGYSHTAAVDLTLGDVTSDVGAGQLYYAVPVVLRATADDGAVTSYIGCYVAHLARPQLQALPPFHPLSIESATFRALQDNEDSTVALSAACAR
jgi:hypothetical protein